ncbi:ABC transporter substrate-binding protein [Paenibacillus hamazuiensis]|uniref:ABC transporter substrate-binding protein n=1 Tax=Paenibacillus hamazuiensis TaxID=2936508 RepID=UPI0020109750|nr:ABC transporter substrate-binding protein [Paenibacillus hamazuiensis]
MSKKMKAAAGLLGIALASSSLLAACGSGSDTGKGAEPAKGAKEEKPYEISMAFMTFSNLKDVGLVQDEISKITKEKINATVKLVPISISAWNQQVNLMLAANENLDLIVTMASRNYGSQVAKGQLVPLDDLLNKYGQGIKDAVGPELLAATKVGGKIYGIPSMRDLATDFGISMRKDLVDKYKIDLSKVKTWEDLEPIFKTIKDNEPGIVPLVQQNNSQTPALKIYNAQFDLLGDSMGVLADSGSDLKVQNLFETKQYADSLALVRKWYQAGYILKDIANSQETGQNLVKAGKAFSYLTNLKPGYEQQDAAQTGKEMAVIRLTKPYMNSYNVTSFMMSIAKNSGNPDKAMQFMNLLYTDKNIANLISNGIEGKHYVKKSDNIIAPVPGVTESGYLFNQWEVGNNYLTYIWEGTDPKIWDQMKAFKDSAVKSKALGFTADLEPIKTEVAAVTNVLNQYKVGLETGTLDPSLLPEFNAKLKAAGLDKIIAEKQKQLDAWLKAEGNK